ncbi:hypothetical protein ACFE04_013616 [Oxalis oulophora]
MASAVTVKKEQGKQVESDADADEKSLSTLRQKPNNKKKPSNNNIASVKKEEKEEDYDDDKESLGSLFKSRPKKVTKEEVVVKEVKKVKKKVEVQTKVLVTEKRVKKTYALPGQKRDPPEEREPLRIFYETLYRQVPNSEMAQFWMMESGLLSKEVAQKVFDKKQKSKQQSNLRSPIKKVASSDKKPKTPSAPTSSAKKKETTTKVATKQTKKRKSKEESSNDEDSDDEDSDDEVIVKRVTKRQKTK